MAHCVDFEYRSSYSMLIIYTLYLQLNITTYWALTGAGVTTILFRQEKNIQ